MKKCNNCGSKNGKARGKECGTWGREIVLCDECYANRK